MPNVFKRVSVPHQDPFENVILPKIGGGSRKDAALKPVPGGIRGRPPTWLTKAPRAGRGQVSQSPQADNRRRVVAQVRYFDKFKRGAKHAKGLRGFSNYLDRLQDIEPALEGGLQESHGEYLTREGRFFSEQSDGLSAADVAQASSGDRRTFEVVVNPYDGRELVSKEFIRSYMREVEKSTGTRLAWFAVIHKADTPATKDNLHAHIIIRGKDLYGKEVRFAREFVQAGFRTIAEDMATSRQGPMTEREMARAREIRERNRERDEKLTAMRRDNVAMWKRRAFSKEWKEQNRSRERGQSRGHEGMGRT